jgi:hypothetical protein
VVLNIHWLPSKAKGRARGRVAKRRCLLEHLETRQVLAAPVANALSLTVTEDVAKAFTLTGSDGDNDPLTFAVTSAPLHGVVSGTGGPGFTYTPVGNYTGSDSFQFKVNDGTTDSAPATVSVTVNNVNDAPVVTQNISSPVNYTRDAPGVHILRGGLDPYLLATVTDPDSADFAGGIFQVQTTAGAHASDRVVVSGRFSIVGRPRSASSLPTAPEARI